MPAAAPNRHLHAGFGDWLGFGAAASASLRTAALHYTYDGQAALYQAFVALRGARRRRVLVPAFHCPTVVEPIVRAGFEVDFYDVEHNLRQPVLPFEQVLSAEHVAVVVINFFGFDFDLGTLPALPAAARPLVIEDCCHSFLRADGATLSGARGDLAIYSFKKLVPCYTGGAIRYNRDDLPRPPPAAQPSWSQVLLHAQRVLRDSLRDSHGSGAILRALRPLRPPPPMLGPASAVPLATAYPFSDRASVSAMPTLARRILHRSDLVACASRRRANFRSVGAGLAPLRTRIAQPLAELDADTCPLGYPLLLPQRATIDYRLKNMGVPFFSFGEQLHPLLLAQIERFPRAAELMQQLLFLTTHQQLDEVQVARYSAAIVDFFQH